MTAQADSIVSYKGFDRNLKCLDMQYEVGKTYTHTGCVEVCESGFHACEYPLDVFRYYAPAGSRFAIVEQGGKLSRLAQDSKIASSAITVSAEISLNALIRAAIEYTFSRAKPQQTKHATGEHGAASATGEHGAASATGEHGAASATGVRGAASATGERGAASATGRWGAASATGVRGAASATSVRGAASATGEQGAASATGVWGAASATGERGAASAIGWGGAALATGWGGAASATGVRGAALAIGWGGRVMGAKGNALFLVERNDKFEIVAVWCGIAGHDGIKADTWYALKDGKPVEVRS